MHKIDANNIVNQGEISGIAVHLSWKFIWLSIEVMISVQDTNLQIF